MHCRAQECKNDEEATARQEHFKGRNVPLACTVPDTCQVHLLDC